MDSGLDYKSDERGSGAVINWTTMYSAHLFFLRLFIKDLLHVLDSFKFQYQVCWWYGFLTDGQFQMSFLVLCSASHVLLPFCYQFFTSLAAITVILNAIGPAASSCTIEPQLIHCWISFSSDSYLFHVPPLSRGIHCWQQLLSPAAGLFFAEDSLESFHQFIITFQTDTLVLLHFPPLHLKVTGKQIFCHKSFASFYFNLLPVFIHFQINCFYFFPPFPTAKTATYLLGCKGWEDEYVFNEKNNFEAFANPTLVGDFTVGMYWLSELIRKQEKNNGINVINTQFIVLGNYIILGTFMWIKKHVFKIW